MSQIIHVYPWKFNKSPTTGSQDIMQTIKCDANADATGIHTKNNVPLPLGGGT